MARLKGFEKLTNVDEALGIFLKALDTKQLNTELVPVADAFERVTAGDIASPVDLPNFDRSAVDGYAIRAEDTFEATQLKPKALEVSSREIVRKGQAKQIWTGNPIPMGSTAVIMLEHVRKKGSCIEIVMPATPSENISRKGEDFKKGNIAIQAGTRLKAYHLGLLAALGVEKADVVRKPRIAIISTGSELVDLGKEALPSQIVNSNRFVISGLCQELNAEPKYLGIARDDEKGIRMRILEGLAKADVVITTGGTSVGAADLVPIAVAKMGKPGILVHGVAMRPGMPTALGILKRKPVFVLSGYPVAAAIGFEVFVRPIILRLLGASNEVRPWVHARLARRVAGALGRRVYLRVRTFEQKSELHAEPILTRGSGLLSSLTRANGYVIIPEDREGLREDEIVTVHLFSSVAGKES